MNPRNFPKSSFLFLQSTLLVRIPPPTVVVHPACLRYSLTLSTYSQSSQYSPCNKDNHFLSKCWQPVQHRINSIVNDLFWAPYQSHRILTLVDDSHVLDTLEWSRFTFVGSSFVLRDVAWQRVVMILTCLERLVSCRFRWEVSTDRVWQAYAHNSIWFQNVLIWSRLWPCWGSLILSRAQRVRGQHSLCSGRPGLEIASIILLGLECMVGSELFTWVSQYQLFQSRI